MELSTSSTLRSARRSPNASVTSRRPRLLSGLLALVLPVALAGGCKTLGFEPEEPDPAAVREDPSRRVEPQHVVVRHCLISFKGAGLANVTRSKEAAEALAKDVFERAQAAGSLDDLVYLYTDDNGPRSPKDGRYGIANYGVRPNAAAKEIERTSLVVNFGNAAFRMQVGDIVLVPFAERVSPHGWHVMQRIQ